MSSSSSSQEITIRYLDSPPARIDIEDVEVDVLVDHFGLAFRPSSLVTQGGDDGKARKIVPIGKKNKLVSGATYHIVPKEDASSNSSSVLSTTTSSRSVPSRDAKRTKRDRPVWNAEDLAQVAQNAAICSKAVYAGTDLECEKYLSEHIRDHGIGKVARSRHGRCCFLLAEEDKDCAGVGGGKRAYIAFRGTHDLEDWRDNLKAYQVEGTASCASSRSIKGKLHSGFLERASQFPIDKILGDETLQDRQLVLCGHSLGGAIATIVAVIMMVEAEKRRKAGFGRDRDIRCFTFGSPLVGDAEFRTFCDENDVSRNLYHFVSDGDPVPRILSYAQCLSALSCQLDNQVRALLNTYSTSQGASFYEEKKRAWIQQKEHYLDVLSRVIPAVEPILEAAALLCPKYSGVLTTAKLGSGLARDLVTASKSGGSRTGRSKKDPYVTIGNFTFLTAESSAPILLEWHEEDRIARCFEIPLEEHIGDTIREIPVHHAVEHYQEFMAEWGGWAGEFEEFYTATIVLAGETVANLIPRRIEIADRYLPNVTSAELVRVQSRHSDILRLRITGYNLFNIVLEQCCFNFGFPFGGNSDKVIVKKMPLGTSVERIIFEEAYAEPPAISDHGTTIVLATQFGDCQYLMNKHQFRNLVIPSVNQISHHESISVLIKRAIQRGMAVAQLRRDLQQSAWKPTNEKIIQEIIKLSSLTLEKAYFEEMCKTFEDTSKSVQFVLSNETEFKKIQSFCDRIQQYLRKPLQIEAEKSIIKKIGIGAATLLGGATLAYLAGPGMVLIGAVEAASMSAASVAGAVGGVGAGLVTHGLLSDRMVDENYEQVLSFVTMELFKKLQSSMETVAAEAGREERAKLLQEVTDLREDGGTFSLEKALLSMYNHELGIDNFVGCDLQNCTKESKLSVINRIECIKTVHSIRSILAKQCYIGVVGLQDAGTVRYSCKPGPMRLVVYSSKYF